MGIAKLVVKRTTPEPVLKAAIGVLRLVVSVTCQDLLNSVLQKRTADLERKVASLLHSRGESAAFNGDRSGATSAPFGASSRSLPPLVEQALACLLRRFRERGLRMRDVARELGCNSNYLATLFAATVGEPLHVRLDGLRVGHACRLLLDGGLLVKEVAYASGFRDQGQLARAFRRYVGVSPIEYRRVFAAPAAGAHRLPAAAAGSPPTRS